MLSTIAFIIAGLFAFVQLTLAIAIISSAAGTGKSIKLNYGSGILAAIFSIIGVVLL